MNKTAPKDTELFQIIEAEEKKQQGTINLTASENYVSGDVRHAQASVLMNKYAEGYPGKRYYGGCAYVDAAETLAIERAKKLFNAEHINVQPHSGSQANMAVYFTLLQPGDTIMGMSLSHGGHLTHGASVSFSGKWYKVVSYGVNQETEEIDYNELEKLAIQHHPKLIICGASAYPRTIDFKRFKEIADKVGARLMADIAHIAGLVAVGLHPSPVPYADFVTTTTHKTLRGPRAGLVLCKGEWAAKLNSVVFPMIQGGPMMHTIAAKAVAFYEALQPEFKAYQQAVVDNAKALASELQRQGLRLVSGGTDNHLVLVDLRGIHVTGIVAQDELESVGIIANRNAIPFDPAPPKVASGIRLGMPAMTTRGFGTAETKQVASMIVRVLTHIGDSTIKKEVAEQVADLCRRFPAPVMS
ncbi:MAG TPA: serine hydroxymethyltransferase [Dehalococcoidia bacterium]|nr:serine hydroxymethyltransferase [Dehalococcoidia bacterium]